MDEIDKTIRKYCILFPELKDDFINNNDETIINIVSDELISKASFNNIVDVSELKNIIRKKIKK